MSNSSGSRARARATEFVGGSSETSEPRHDGSLLETVRREAYLVLQSGAKRGAEYTLRADRVTIGRGEDSDVAIDEPAASRRHAQIERRGGLYFLRDLGSTNGTFLHKLLHGGEAALRDGDRFRIGTTELVFRNNAGG
jgi:pSer/pThr/pTyr-binding forkhead associated (FHA) protein